MTTGPAAREARGNDRLLSVAQVARDWGVGITTVASLIQNGTLPSLDRGRLVAEGKYDIPLIRLSWADEFRAHPANASWRLEPSFKGMSPPAETAIDFHAAVDAKDVDAIYRLSSAATQATGDPEEVAQKWSAAVGEVMNPSTGVATGVYTLLPFDAVAVRIVADAPQVPRMYPDGAPMFVKTFLPLVEEKEGWKVDLGIWEQQAQLCSLLTESRSV